MFASSPLFFSATSISYLAQSFLLWEMTLLKNKILSIFFANLYAAHLFVFKEFQQIEPVLKFSGITV
jgi:hypothetical protein